MRLVSLLVLGATTGAAFEPCDLAACTCAGVRLGDLRGAAPLQLTDGSHTYLLSICAPLGPTVQTNGTCPYNGADLAQKASFARIGGTCEELGDTATMAAEIVVDGDHRVLVVRYNYTYGAAKKVTIAFAKGTDHAPKVVAGASVTVKSADSFAIDWDGLAEDPPVPTPPVPPPPTPPVNPEPEPEPEPAPVNNYHCEGSQCKMGRGAHLNYPTDSCDGQCKAYTCQCVIPGPCFLAGCLPRTCSHTTLSPTVGHRYAQCIEDARGEYGGETCDDSCHMYRCNGAQCDLDDNSGSFPDCTDRCHLYKCAGDQCVIDDDAGNYPDNTCSGNCEAEPPPPPTPGAPCKDSCHCGGVDLSTLPGKYTLNPTTT